LKSPNSLNVTTRRKRKIINTTMKKTSRYHNQASKLGALTWLRTVLAAALIGLTIVSCGVFSDKRDRVLEGSLTLTPLRLPKDVSSPDNRNAMQIPEVPYEYTSNVEQSELEKPPLLDVALASEMEKKLGSAVDQKKSDIKTFPVSLVEVAGGLAELSVDGDFDLLWPYMENVLDNLGFKIDDRNRSEHRYFISRQLPDNPEAKLEVKNTGVERTVGNAESYQIEVAPKESATTKIANVSVIRVRNSQGQVENSALSRHMLAQIKAYLEQPLQ